MKNFLMKLKLIVKSYVYSFPKDCVFKTNYNGGFECISNSFLDVALVVEMRWCIRFCVC